ncbi:MAG: InlB B-repeat-containing protein [Methanobrevibacter sp.]|nr:InlB B-repeat-containing protein [Methanobrevibacter sp.]
MKLSQKLFVIQTLFIFMVSVVSTAAYAATTTLEERDNSILIESKEKTAEYQINWNNNGGKIGSKKTEVSTVKKGSKIKNFVTTPKRTSYTFKGWYTRKTGGTKISKNTIPKKSVTYYAHWTKSSTSTNAKSKLIGTWKYHYGDGRTYKSYTFWNNGSFKLTDVIENPLNDRSGSGEYSTITTIGKYNVNNNKIFLTNRVSYYPDKSKYSGNNLAFEFKFGKDNKGEYINIAPSKTLKTFFIKWRKS